MGDFVGYGDGDMEKGRNEKEGKDLMDFAGILTK